MDVLLIHAAGSQTIINSSSVIRLRAISKFTFFLILVDSSRNQIFFFDSHSYLRWKSLVCHVNILISASSCHSHLIDFWNVFISQSHKPHLTTYKKKPNNILNNFMNKDGKLKNIENENFISSYHLSGLLTDRTEKSSV